MIYSLKEWYPKYKRNLCNSTSKANKTPKYKWRKDLNRYFFQGRQTESQHTHENIVSIPNHQECENQYLRQLHTFQNEYLSKRQKKCVDEEKRESSSFVSGDVCWCSNYEKQHIYSSKKIKIETLYDLVLPYLCAYSRNKNIN